MKRLFCIPACLLALSGYAQREQLTLMQGPSFTLPSKSAPLAFFNTAQGLVNLSLAGETAATDIFNTEPLALKEEKQTPVTRPLGSDNNEMIVDLGSHHYWLHSDWNADAEKSTLYYDKMDPLTGQLLSVNNKLLEGTKLASSYTSKGTASFTIGHYGHESAPVNMFNLHCSPDHKKLLTAYRYKTIDDVFQTIGVAVYDENLKKIWGGEFTMPVRAYVVEYLDYKVDNNGNVYVLAIVYHTYGKRRENTGVVRDERDKNTGKAAYHYTVYTFTQGNKNVASMDIDGSDFFLKEGALMQDTSHDELFFTAAYSKAPNVSGADGVFVAKMSKAGKMEKYKQGFYEFPAAEATRFKSEKAAKKEARKNGAICPALKIQDLFFESDGGFVIAAEAYNFKIDSYVTPPDGHYRSDYIYTYGSIYAIHIDAAGNMTWSKKIPKQQQSTRIEDEIPYHPYSGTIGYWDVKGPVTMSFKIIPASSGYYFLYVDNKSNQSLDDADDPALYTEGKGNDGGQLVAVKVDSNGKVSRQVLMDIEKDVEVSPALLIRLNDRQMAGRIRLKEYTYAPFIITVK